MGRVSGQLSDLAPALAFLLAGVPLAALLDELGFFDAVAGRIVARSPRGTPVLALWLLAAATTAVLNLDTTVVLLGPLYLRLARRSDADPVSLALVPLLLAGLASSVLPVSNLTTLIAADHFALGVGDVVGRVALPSLAATAVGWWAYRRRHATRLAPGMVSPDAGTTDAHALRVGGAVVAAVLVGFVVGPSFGVAPWMVAVVADAVLVAVTRTVPWRVVPLTTAVAVAGVAVVVAIVVPERAAHLIGAQERPASLAAVAALAAVGAGLVNNLPALLAALGRSHHVGWGFWAWLVGVNVGAVLVPSGALANLLWLRIMAAEGVPVTWRRYVALVVPVAAPAFAAAVAVLVVERLVAG
ncbi:MAG: ArsB/NhaD family transporter [Acidimicrobiales bacterium]